MSYVELYLLYFYIKIVLFFTNNFFVFPSPPLSYLYSEQLIDRPKSELNKDELSQLEEFEFKHGPMSLINDSMQSRTPIIISLRNNHKIIARVKAFDRHCNMVLENVKELWTEKKWERIN